MGECTIAFSELKMVPYNLWGLIIVEKLIEAGAPIKLGKNKASVVMEPITDDDVIFTGTLHCENKTYGLVRKYWW
jgi:hypothetical protein